MEDKKRIKIEKRPLYREEIKAALIQAMTSGELAPGDRIVETRWAKELGVSQSPIREAIRELEMIGLVENIPYKGCMVRKITKKESADTYKVRIALESMAMIEAIQSEDTSFLAQMKATMQEMTIAAEAGDVQEFVAKDVQFHATFVQHSENSVLKRHWEQCYIWANTTISTYFSHDSMLELAKRHELLLEAIEAKDEVRGKKEIEEHFDMLLKSLGEIKEKAE